MKEININSELWEYCGDGERAQQVEREELEELQIGKFYTKDIVFHEINIKNAFLLYIQNSNDCLIYASSREFIRYHLFKGPSYSSKFCALLDLNDMFKSEPPYEQNFKECTKTEFLIHLKNNGHDDFSLNFDEYILSPEKINSALSLIKEE